MKDKFIRAKKLIRDNPVKIALVVGGVIGAAGMRYGLKDRLVPDANAPYLFASNKIRDCLVKNGGYVSFDTDAGPLYLTAINPITE